MTKEETKMQTGKVKWFNEGKGFGFIASGGKDFFVHFKEIKIDGFKTLKEGQAVKFEAGQSDKGAVAKDVHLIDG
jgi:CspA family cold shock protein